MFLSGAVNYTEIYFECGKTIMSSSTLLRHQERLESFIRVSRKHLVNPEFIKGVEIQGKVIHLKMKDGNQLKVSRRRVKDVLSNITLVTSL